MGDSAEGSSNAAQGALRQDRSEGQIEEPPSPGNGPANGPVWDKPRGGVFKRIFGALGPSEPTTEAPGAPAVSGINGHGMLNLRRLAVEDVMIPKADIIAVPAGTTKDDLVAVFRDSGLSRLPVYEDTLDTPIGMAHLKDFALQHGFNGGGKGRFALRKLLRPLLFVPPSMPTGVLLTKMQTERRHMALVIDEYGGVDGLVTIEDLIEQVIGEIEDEHDQDEDALYTRRDDGTWLAQAKTPLDEFEAAIGRPLTVGEDIDAEEIDTLGGLVFMLIGRVPVRGEVVRHPGAVEFEVVDADPRRIKRLKVRVSDNPGAPTKPASADAPDDRPGNQPDDKKAPEGG